MPRVLPLAIGGAMSPMVLILQLMLLSRGKSSLTRSWLYVAGNLLVVIAWAVAGLSLGRHLLVSDVSSDPVVAYVEVVLALILLSLAFRTLRSPAFTMANQSPPAYVTLRAAFLVRDCDHGSEPHHIGAVSAGSPGCREIGIGTRAWLAGLCTAGCDHFVAGLGSSSAGDGFRRQRCQSPKSVAWFCHPSSPRHQFLSGADVLCGTGCAWFLGSLKAAGQKHPPT